MLTSTPPPLPAARAASTASGIFRTLLWIGFAVTLILFAVLAGIPAFFGASPAGVIGVVAAAVAVSVALRRLPVSRWMRVGVAYAVLAMVLVYLATDDASIRRPVSTESISPSFPGAEKSYEVLMLYGKQHSLGRAFRAPGSQKISSGKGAWKPKDPEWRTWLTTNQEEIESNWTKLAPVREWWDELNTFDQIGDLTPARVEAEMMTFAPIRALSQHACAIASLQAMDGKGDAAMETLLPMLEVSRKLEPSSRTLVRSMIVLVVQKLALETATFVLDTTTVSPATRVRLAKALTGGSEAAEGVRRLLAVEYAWATSVNLDPQSLLFNAPEWENYRWFGRAAIPVSRLVFNPRRTMNLYGDLTAELQDLASRREIARIEARPQEFLRRHDRFPFKNVAGSLLLSYLTPAYKKIVESYWTIEDLRSALHTRLQA